MKWKPDSQAVAQAGLDGKYNGQIATATGPKTMKPVQDHKALDNSKPDPNNK